MGCIGDMLLHCAILYVVVDVITSIICTTYTYKVLHKFFIYCWSTCVFKKCTSCHSCTVHLDTMKVFYLATDAQ
jgi:hypothetical protein